MFNRFTILTIPRSDSNSIRIVTRENRSRKYMETREYIDCVMSDA